MIGYIRVHEAAAKWNVSERHVQRLCIESFIEGAVKFGTTWAIPENAPKPTRTAKNGKLGRKPKTREVE